MQEDKLVAPKSYTLLIVVCSVVVFILATFAVSCWIKNKKSLILSEEELDSAPSFMDETILEQIRQVRESMKEKEQESQSLARMSELSEEELAEKEDEIPEEFRDFFKNAGSRKWTRSSEDAMSLSRSTSKDSSLMIEEVKKRATEGLVVSKGRVSEVKTRRVDSSIK